MKNSTTASTGTMARNTTASRTLITQESRSPMTSMTGPRRSGLKPVTSAFWITVTSVVIRVTSELDSKSSRLEKSKRWTWANSARRRFAPRPMAARAEKRA